MVTLLALKCINKHSIQGDIEPNTKQFLPDKLTNLLNTSTNCKEDFG